MEYINDIMSVSRIDYLLVLADFASILFVAVAGMLLFKYIYDIQLKKSVQRKMEQKRRELIEKAEERYEKEREEFESSGYQSKTTFLEKTERLFRQANLYQRFPSDTVETLLFKMAVVVFMVCIGCFLATKNWLIVFGGGIATVVFLFALVQGKADKNYKAIEDEILHFINLADGFSSSADDVVDIIGKTYPKLKEPLRTYGEEFYLEALHGNVELAFQHFEEKIPNKKFSGILHNIYVCSNSTTDYKNLFESARLDMREYVDGKKERKNIKKDKEVDFFIVFAVTLFAFYMAMGFSENSKYLIFGTIMGKIVVAAYLLLVAISIIAILKTDKK